MNKLSLGSLVVVASTALLLSLGSFSGCGSSKQSSPGNSGSPLTSDQKARFAGTMNRIGRTQRAISNNASNAPTLEASLEDAALSAGQMNEDDREKAMTSAVKSGCQLQLPEPAPSASTTPDVDMTMAAQGDQCPIDASFELHVKNSKPATSGGANMEMDVNYRFSVKDSTFASLSDITAFHLKGKSSLQFSSSGVSGKESFRGDAKSTQDGDIGMSLSGTLSSSGHTVHGDEIFVLKYKDGLSVELEDKMTANGQSRSDQFFLNGQTISKSEYASYFSKSGFAKLMTSGSAAD